MTAEFFFAEVSSDDAKVLIISVAARMAGMHPQTLRQYDRMGLVQPGRAAGGGRRYSTRDVARHLSGHCHTFVSRLRQTSLTDGFGGRASLFVLTNVSALKCRVPNTELADRLSKQAVAIDAHSP